MRYAIVRLAWLLLIGTLVACGGPQRPTPTLTVPAPPPTPTAAFGDYIGLGGYPFVTTEDVGSIVAGTRVRISHTYFDGVDTIYAIVTENERTTAEARERQLTYAPDVTPGAPLPTAAYQDTIGLGGYPLVTTEAVGGIPAGVRVRISHAEAHYDGWVYVIMAEDEQTIAEAREHQLAFAPDVTPGAPEPTSAFQRYIGISQYMLVTTEAVGGIPAGARVRINHAQLHYDGWVYVIVAEDGQTTAEAREHQLTFAPDVTPGAPTPAAGN